MTENLPNGLRAPLLYEQGAALAAVNSEVKALLLGITSLQGGVATVPALHEIMLTGGASELFAYSVVHTREPLKSLDPTIAHFDTKADRLHLTDRGNVVAGLGGALLEHFSIAPETTGSLSRIIGFSKRTDGQTMYPAPTTRMLILRKLLRSNGKGTRPKELIDIASTFGISEESVRGHIKNLEHTGAVETITTPKRSKRLTPQGRNNAVALVETVDTFMCNTDEMQHVGLAYVGKALAKAQQGDIPLLVKKSILGSGKQSSPALQALNTLIHSNFEGRQPMTTAQIARELGLETGYVHHNLMRISRNLGTASSVALITGGGIKGVEQVWSFRKPTIR